MITRSVDELGVIDRLEDIFERRGKDAYLGEPVTVAEHMYQSAALALAANAPDVLVAAALLHDVGHFTSEFGSYTPDDTLDRHHDSAGAAILEGFFPELVIACVRMHVRAKRYLCTIDPAYLDGLSSASRHSLSLQGGLMNHEELAEFEKVEFHREAVAVRIWDDGAKNPGMQAGCFQDFRPLLERVVIRAPAMIASGS